MHQKKVPIDETMPMHEQDDREKSKQGNRKTNLANLRTFVLVSGILMCAQSSLSMYTKSVLTSIERRFQISSSLAGLIVGSFNFGNIVFVVLVSKLSSEGNRPRIMAIGSMIVAFGGFMNVIPHISGPKYNPSLVEAATESAGFKPENNTRFLHGGNNSSVSCSTSNAYVILVLGEMLQGIGATVLVPLGSSYIDDFAEHGKSPLYLGIMFLLQNLGPGVGYLVGSLTSSLYVDFNRVDSDEIYLEKNDSAWVGAWWLGYIIIGTCVIFCAIPLFWFPRTMDKKLHGGRKTIRGVKYDGEELKMESCDDYHLQVDGNLKKCEREDDDMLKKNRLTKLRLISNCEKMPSIFADLYSTIKRLLLNPVYMLIVMGYSSLMFVVGVLTAFMPKFLEIVFYQSKSKASLIFGLSMPIVICLGLFSGGFIVQRSKLGEKGTMLFIACVAGATIFFCVPSYYITCDINMGSACVESASNMSTNSTLCLERRGDMCVSRCYSFVALMSLAAFLSCHIVTPSYSVILRTVSPKDKCTAIGLKFLIIRLAAFIPSPLITGAVIDDTCIRWSASPTCVGTATCLQYDTESFRTSYLHIIFVSVVMTFLFNLCACLVQRRRDKGEQNNTIV